MQRTPRSDDNKRDPQTYAVLGAAMEVHRQLGPGFLEAVYQEALGYEFLDHNIPFKREICLPVRYKDPLLVASYKADFICFEAVVVETKAINLLTSIEDAQLINYLKATGFHRGLLLNFGSRRLQYKRFVYGDLSCLSAASASSVDPLLEN